MKAVIDNLKRNNNTTVINLNSRLGSITHQNIGTFKDMEVSYSYRIAKSSQNMLTNSLRLEFEDVNFVSLTPGRLSTKIEHKAIYITPAECTKIFRARPQSLYQQAPVFLGSFLRKFIRLCFRDFS
jgi:hypothetical protein